MMAGGRVCRFSANAAGDDWVVGDIHGCFATLELMLDEIGFDPAVDRLFSVGDLADRGPESERALEYLQESWFHVVRGNHEQFLLDSIDDLDAQLVWLMNGGAWFNRLAEETQAAFSAAFSALPYLIEVETDAGTVGIVHADVPLGLDWSEVRDRTADGDRHVLDTLLWGRHRAIAHGAPSVAGISHVFCGHTPIRPSVRIVGNVHFIDQGAVFGLQHRIPDSGLTVVSIDGSRARTRAAVWPSGDRSSPETEGLG